jgi:hypothetical protein
MTRYEQLVNKANKCQEAAANTEGLMSSIWQAHAIALEAKARALTIQEAEAKC